MDWCVYDNDLRHERVKNLSDFSTINDETLSLLHVNARRLTVSTTLEQVLRRWDDAKKKVLSRICPNAEEYKEEFWRK